MTDSMRELWYDLTHPIEFLLKVKDGYIAFTEGGGFSATQAELDAVRKERRERDDR